LLTLLLKKADSVEACGKKQRRTSTAEMNHLWMGALEKGDAAHLVHHEHCTSHK